MLSGRHFILLGILACAGLLSVHDGQLQTDLCYQIGAVEKELRDVRSEIQLSKIKFHALQSPKNVMTRAVELKLTVEPVSPALELPMTAVSPQTTPQPRSLGTAQGQRSGANAPTPPPASRTGSATRSASPAMATSRTRN